MAGKKEYIYKFELNVRKYLREWTEDGRYSTDVRVSSHDINVDSVEDFDKLLVEVKRLLEFDEKIKSNENGQ